MRAPDHRCNAYCAPPEHAYMILVEPPPVTPDLCVALCQRFLAPQRHWQIVQARAAPEADAGVINQQKDEAGCTSVFGLDADDDPATWAPWLIHYVDLDEQEARRGAESSRSR